MRYLLFTILLLQATFSQCQPFEKAFIKKYSQTDGLSSYNVRNILQDKQGFLWVATQDGISRFDGKTFSNYTKTSQEAHKICGVDIREMVEDTGRNLLWILPGENGINAINTITGNVCKTILLPYKNAEEWNMSMTLNRNRLWIGTYNGIYIYDIPRDSIITKPIAPTSGVSDSSQFQAREMVSDNSGNIWVCSNGYGILILDGITFKMIRHIDVSQLNTHSADKDLRFRNHIALNDSTLLFATSQGLKKITYDAYYNIRVENSPCSAMGFLNVESVECVQKINETDLLLASHEKLYRLNLALTGGNEIKEAGNISESNWLQSVQFVYADKSENIWLGCEQGLAFLSGARNPFTSYYYDKTTKQKLEHLRSLFVNDNGDILAGLRNGIAEIDNKTKEFKVRDSLHLYHHIFKDRRNLIHVFRDDGMFIYESGKITPVTNFYPEFENVSSYPVNSHIFLTDSSVLLGTENDNGILLWDYVHHTVRQTDKNSRQISLGSNIVNNIYLDHKKNIWVLSDNVISIVSNDYKRAQILEIKNKAASNKFNLFFDMCETKGSYWIASYGNGIIQLDSNYNFKQLISTQSGLSNDGVYNVFSVGDSELAVTTNYGLSVYNIVSRHFKNYYQSDGLHSNAFEEVASVYQNNLIYAGGVNGFTVINPQYFTDNNTPPAFYFTNIHTQTTNKATDTSNLFLHELTISDNWLQTNISFIGLNYLNPTRVIYQYRIREKSSNWIVLNTQNFVSLIGLSPGTYTLEVKAANENGRWSQPKELKLTFLPKWYQTFLFKMVLSASVVLLLYSLYWFRVTNIRKQQQIRQNISSDLHDDIGATLNSIKLFAHLALNTTQKEKYLSQIIELLTQATAGLRDMIWVLDDSRDSIQELITRIQQFAAPVAEASGIRISVTADESIKNELLNKTEKRNLFLIAKESVNNCIKYAGCSHINVCMQSAHKKMMLRIEDNGTGFDENKIMKGNGLYNIRERAKQIQYTAVIFSSLGNGTQIILTKNNG